jgi:hypothetical protein
LQLVLKLDGSLVNDSGKSVTSHVISVYIFAVSAVELNCYRIFASSALVGVKKLTMHRQSKEGADDSNIGQGPDEADYCTVQLA